MVAEVKDQAAFRAMPSAIDANAMVMYVHGPLEEEVEDALLAYARGGGRLVLLHHAIASARLQNKRWLAELGVAIRPRGSGQHAWEVVTGDVQVVNLLPGHYITSHGVHYPKRIRYTPSDHPSAEQELPAFELPATEAFVNQLFTDARRKTLLLGFSVTTGGRTIQQDRAGWTLPLGRGQVVYLQPGHRPEDFRNPCFVQIIRNAIEWRADR
jgi:type 1 glutamine amidotransferase